jgi:ER membrane protein complex subunit 7
MFSRASSRWLSTALILLSLFLSARAAVLRIHIASSSILVNPHTLPASTHATLTSSVAPPLRSLLRRDLTLEFNNLTLPATYLLNIFSHSYTFASYRVDITASSSPDTPPTIHGIYEAYPGSHWSTHGPLIAGSALSHADAPGPHPQIVAMSAKLLAEKSFYEARPGFNPMSLLKNPMILLGAVALAITFGMPKLMENMDPEMKAEYEEMQKKSPVSGLTRAMQGQGPAGSAGGFDLAGWMAGAQQGGSRTSCSDARDGGIRERRK